MLELLVLLAFFGYIYYIRNFADLRTESEKREDALALEQELLGNKKSEETADTTRQNNFDNPKTAQQKAPFIDRRLIASMVLAVFNSALCVYVIQQAEGVHFPYLVAVGAAISIGFAEPKKGWILAIIQAVLIFIGFAFITNSNNPTEPTELQYFSLVGSIVLTFAASFIGAFLKRAFSMK